MSRLKLLLTILLALLLAIAGTLLARKVYNEMNEERKRKRAHEDISNDIPISEAARPSATLLLFFADWCDACKKIKKQWNAFHDTYHDNPKQLIGHYRVQCRRVDCSYFQTNTDLQQLMDRYDVQHFPSVVLLVPTTAESSTSFVKFKGRVTKDNLHEFVKQTLSEI